jgi:hypothetical protein
MTAKRTQTKEDASGKSFIQNADLGPYLPTFDRLLVTIPPS